MKAIMAWCMLFWIPLVLASCRAAGPEALASAHGTTDPPAAARPQFEFSKVVMGTRGRVVLHAATESEAAEAAAEAFAVMANIEDSLSDYRADSEAMRLVRQPPGVFVPVSAELGEILNIASYLSSESRGAFDITIGPLTHRWRAVRQDGQLPEPDELAALQTKVGMQALQIWTAPRGVVLEHQGMILDFGGIGKGFAAQKAWGRLAELGYADSMAEIGGDLVVGAPPPGKPGWAIAIATGLDQPTVRTLSWAGVATSGDAEQFVEIDGTRYSHLVDPRTGLGLTERIAVTVIVPKSRFPWDGADLGGHADGIASAVSVLGADEGARFAKRLNVEAIIVTANE